MFSWLSSKIEVTFVDNRSGEIVGRTRLEPSQLPESFAIETTLHLGDEDWGVVEARPETRGEYLRSKKLEVRIVKIERIDPGEILFSLPSICDAIPGSDGPPSTEGDFVISDDDWRQVEFVSRGLSSEVEQEIAAILEIHQNESAGVGWKKVHVRSRPISPLTCLLPLGELKSSLESPTETTAVKYRGAGSQIPDSFAIRAPNGPVVYGLAPGGLVKVVGVGHYGGHDAVTAAADLLRSIAQKHDLMLVHWCRCIACDCSDPRFVEILANP